MTTMSYKMRSPAVGLAFTIYQKHRIGFGVIAGYLVLATVGMRCFDMQSGAGVLVAPFGFALLYLMAIFANSEADISSTRSGYPSHLFSLPVRTTALVLYPMIYGISTVAFVWIAFAALILAPHTNGAIVWWPAPLLAALMACLQAFSWYPVPLPYLRGILAFGALAALVCLATFRGTFGLSDIGLSMIYLGVILFAGYAAIRGVSSAREGRSSERAWLSERKRAITVDRPFASPARAQLWLEWKRNGLVLPFVTLLACLLSTIPVALALRDAAAGNPAWQPLWFGHVKLHIVVASWILTLLSAPYIALVAGCCPYKADTFRPDYTLQPFAATRPLSNVDIVLAKVRMAALSTISAWAIQCLFLAGWLLLPAQDGDRTGTFAGIVLPYMTLKSGIFTGLVLFALIFWTWANQVAGLWTLVSGRRALVTGWSAGLPFVLALLLARTITNLSDGRTFFARMFPHLHALMIGIAVLKLMVIVGAVVSLRKYRLASTSALTRAICVWLLIGAGLWAIVKYVLPRGYISPVYLAIGVFLFLPLGRLLIAPLALRWNRCR